MSILLAAITGKQKPGLYQLEQDITLEEISQLCQANGCQLFYIDGKSVNNKEEFLQSCAKGMNFPDYFGNNWDAFEDCLTDLEWYCANRYILLYSQPENFEQKDPEQWTIALDILHSVIDYWADTNSPMYVFLQYI